MLRIIENQAGHILEVEAVGKVSAEDYREVLVPALETMLSAHAKTRLLYLLGPKFDGFTGGAAWQDAKLGMKHFTSFERVAVVTDIDWIENMVRAFGFTLPGDVETFAVDDLDKARKWIAEPRSQGELEFELDEVAGVLVLKPHDDLEAADFERVTAALDPYLEKAGTLRGVMIVTDEFPGWDSVAAMTSHFRFVRDHQAKIRRIAFVTSSHFLSALPHLTKWFIDAKVRHFERDEYDQALAWVSSA